MLKFILGGAGYGKSTLINQSISEYVKEEKRVIVIVPEQFSFDSDKKLYKTLGAENFNKILSLSFTSLARDIFERYGSKSGEYADDIQKYIIMNKTIKELSKSLTYFGKQAEKITFADEAMHMVTDFRQSGKTPDEVLDKLGLSDATTNEKLMDMAQIYYTYDRLLREHNLKDSLTDISEAAAIANINDYFEDTVVFFDEFESFTGDEYDLIDTIIAGCDDVFISLRLENEGDNQYTIFDSVNSTWKRFVQIAGKYGKKTSVTHLEEPKKYNSSELSHINRYILRPERKVYGEAQNVKVIECRDLYEEADYICSEINRLVRTQGYKYSDIAVMSRQLSEYVYVFEAAFKKYEIPYCLNVKKSVMHTSVMQLVSSVLEIISVKAPDSESVFRYTKTGLNNFGIENIAALENYCYEWSIDGKKWFEPFTCDIENNPLAEEMRKKIMEPIMKLKERCQSADSRQICVALYDFLEETGVPMKVYDVCESFEENGMLYLSKEMKRIWGIFTDTLDSVAQMGGEMDISEFRDIFLMLLRQITYSVPPQTLDGVSVLCAETARPDSPKISFVCGVNEGCFPSDIKVDGLLSEREKALLESIGISLSRDTEELISDEKLVVYKTLTHASDRLYILYPLSDLSGKNRYPAIIIKQIQDMFTNDVKEFASEKGLLFYSSTLQAAYCNYVKNFSDASGETAALRNVLEKDEFYRTKISYLEKISQEKKIEISDKELIRKLYSDRLNISATGFEEFNFCHFKFFCNTGLKLKKNRKREMDNLEYGNLVHKCLETVLGSCKSKEEFDALNSSQIAEAVKKCTEEYYAENLGGDTQKTKRTTQLLSKINSSIETLITHLQEELRQSEFRPAALELNLSQNGAGMPILRTENGIEVILRGIVDRIDVYESDGKKYLRVIDYKTGAKKFSLDSLLYGINMQMLIYMFSVTGKNGIYSDYTPSGVLYMPSGEISCGRGRDEKSGIDEYIKKHYKMNGVVVSDRNVLSAMEKDILGIYIPAALVKDDSGSGELKLNKKSSSCLSFGQFEKLRAYTEGFIEKMCNELYSGDIDANPLVMGNKSPCGYCDYWSVCGNMPCEKYRETVDDAKEAMLEILNEKEEENEQVD